MKIEHHLRPDDKCWHDCSGCEKERRFSGHKHKYQLEPNGKIKVCNCGKKRYLKL